jgi:hypothetical protein
MSRWTAPTAETSRVDPGKTVTSDRRAAARRKVVTVRAADLDPNLIPLPFNIFHTCVDERTFLAFMSE